MSTLYNFKNPGKVVLTTTTMAAVPRSFVFCWLLFSVVCWGQHHVQNCAELELLGILPNEKLIKVQQDSVLNLTFALNTQNCALSSNRFMVTLTTNKNGLGVSVVICKVFLHNGTCLVTDLTHGCACVNDDTVQFIKKAMPEDSKIFAWKWRSTQSLRDEKQREITLVVECKCQLSNFQLTLSMIIAWSCVTCILIAFTCCVIRRMWRFRAYRLGRQEEKILYVYKVLDRHNARSQKEAKDRSGNSRDTGETSKSHDAACGTGCIRLSNYEKMLIETVDGYLEPVQVISARLCLEERRQACESTNRFDVLTNTAIDVPVPEDGREITALRKNYSCAQTSHL